MEMMRTRIKIAPRLPLERGERVRRWGVKNGLVKGRIIMFVPVPNQHTPPTLNICCNSILQKEVERRRRGNINEGINELGRIVPNGSGEKAKGAILSRAVQYIHHLKDNEARNIEKWTLEKLLMDQAMGDLQSQLEEMRRAWEEERDARETAERELEQFKSGRANPKTSHVRSRSPKTGKKAREEEDEDEDEEEEEEEESEEEVEEHVKISDTRASKRQRVE